MFPKLEEEIENLPDIFFYIFIKGQRVAFQRISTKNFVRLRKFCFLKLIPDVYNKYDSSNYKGGLLKYSLRIYDRPKKELSDIFGN
jgi:hypothetical protein